MGFLRRPDVTHEYVICTTTTFPVAPYEGLLAYTTNTDEFYVYSGSAWLQFAPPIPHSDSVILSVASATATTSATFVAMQNVTEVTNFVKYRADTKIVVEWGAVITNDNSLGGWEVGVNFNSTDNVLGAGIGATGNRAGFRQFTGVAAGTYTFGLRRRRSNATGNVRDGDAGFAYNLLRVIETY